MNVSVWMSKQVIIRVDDELKVLADVIMTARGESQQTVLSQAYMDYVFKYAGTMQNGDELLQATYTYIIERQKSDVAPLLERIEQIHSTKAAEEARQQENIQLYEKVKATGEGKRLLDLIARCLRSEDQNFAFMCVYEDNHSAIKDLVDTDDDNEAVKVMKILATIHANT